MQHSATFATPIFFLSGWVGCSLIPLGNISTGEVYAPLLPRERDWEQDLRIGSQLPLYFQEMKFMKLLLNKLRTTMGHPIRTFQVCRSWNLFRSGFPLLIILAINCVPVISEYCCSKQSHPAYNKKALVFCKTRMYRTSGSGC